MPTNELNDMPRKGSNVGVDLPDDDAVFWSKDAVMLAPATNVTNIKVSSILAGRKDE